MASAQTASVLPAADVGVKRAARRRSPALIAAIVILGTLLVLCFGAPLFTSYNPVTQDISHALLPPSIQHLLGTDAFGRDVWARVLYGGRIDFLVGVIAVFSPFVIGTAVGLAAGYFGRWLDTISMSVVDVVRAFPFFVLVITIVFVLGPGVTSIYIAITIVGWTAYARIVRAEVLVAKRQEYVLAAMALGYSRWRIIMRHLLPNVVTQALVYAMSDIVFIILTIVTLGYLGLGVPAPTPEWGSIISDGQIFLTTNWMLSTIPGMFVVVTGLGLSLLGDGLADLLRPE